MIENEDRQPLFTRNTVLAALGVTAAALIFLALQGRVWWCRAGDYAPWAWDIWSTHNSQHVIDPYSFTHVLHGVLEFWLIGLVLTNLPLRWRFVLAVVIESAWEALENSSLIIERYRAATISLDYFGDSIINSVADIACCAIGFMLAYKLRFWRSLIFFAATEFILIATIRDSLIINLIMLISPVETIKVWQMAGR